MAVTVREALRRLCADGGGWSYAVMWRSAESGGVRHLVWGEGYCETPWISSSPGDLHGDGDLKFQDDVGVGAVMEKLKSEVHVLGYGLIGCAALTGKHRWINRNATVEGFNSLGSAGSNHLLLSGIQTVAVIPVLPHGVVQLGSVNMVMEDVGFVNHVRHLVLQLECVPREVVFDNVSNGFHQNIPTIIQQLIGESVSHQTVKIPTSFCVAQPSSSSVSEITESRILTSREVPLRSSQAITTSSSSITEFLQPKAVSTIGFTVSPVGEHQAQFQGKSYVSSNLYTGGKQQLLRKNMTSENKLMSSVLGSKISCDSSFVGQISDSVSGSSANERSNLDMSVPTCLNSQKVSDGLYSESRIGVLAVSSRELLTGNKLTKISNNSKDLNEFARIPYFANYSIKHAPRGEDELAHDNPNADHNFANANAAGGNMRDEISQISPTIPLGNHSAVCSTSFSPRRCAMEGANLDRCIKEERQCSSIPTVAECITDITAQKSGNDLFDALGLYDRPVTSTNELDGLFGDMHNSDGWNSCTDGSFFFSQLDTSRFFDDSTCETTFSDARHDQLLDAVVSNVNIDARHTVTTDMARPAQSKPANACSPSKHGQLSLSAQLQPQLLGNSPLVEAGLACSSVKSSCHMAITGGYYSEDGYKAQVSSWSENDQNIKSDSASLTQFKKADEMGKTTRKRSKPGENPKPRPKDRQMIQDRVKELREIVPNGAKLSIDALLERTIKHMLFLQSVTKHADKLKDIGKPKIISKDGGLLLKDDFEGGATWAFELGSQTMICPIIVEDLHPPRQLLVEMLCEERGFFLEIADLIKGLGFTILKGLMEARGDKIWARFAVEANRDVTRMDVFLSLVHLLEPKEATGAAKQGFNNTDTATSMSCPYLPQAGASKPL